MKERGRGETNNIRRVRERGDRWEKERRRIRREEGGRRIRKGGSASGVEEEDQDGDGAGRWKEGIIRVGE